MLCRLFRQLSVMLVLCGCCGCIVWKVWCGVQAPKYAETQLYGLLYTSSESDDMSSVPSSRREASQLVGGFIALVLEKPYKCFFLWTVVLQFLVLTALCKRSCEYSIGTADSHMLHIMHCWNHMRTCHSNVVFVWLIECACDNQDRNMRYTCSMKQDISAAKGPSSVADTKHQLFGIYL